MSSSPNQLPIGQVIGSRYRIQSLIGRGGMGLVFSATHELTGRRVALKLMLAEGEDSPVLHERFLTEARTAAAVRHPNIVDVLDMGLHDGAPYLVMELIEGVSLERLLESQSRLSVEQTLSWMFPIMGALAVLHDAGIVHRDVKPSNIILSTLPRHPMRPKLLDFGLARMVTDLRLTRSGTVIGTPLYMAPEHAAGMATGPQADVWSVAVVLYECIAGCSPFNYTDRSSLAAQVLAGLVQPLSQVRPDLPELLSIVLGRAMQRDLTRRFPDMRSFAHALLTAAISSGIRPPVDPDSIGLPEYNAWQSGHGAVGVTWDQHDPRLPAPELAPTDAMPRGSLPDVQQTSFGVVYESSSSRSSRPSSPSNRGSLQSASASEPRPSAEPGGSERRQGAWSRSSTGTSSSLRRFTIAAVTLLVLAAGLTYWRASLRKQAAREHELAQPAEQVGSQAAPPPAPAVTGGTAPNLSPTPSSTSAGAGSPSGPAPLDGSPSAEGGQARDRVPAEATRTTHTSRPKRGAGARPESAKPAKAAMRKSPSDEREDEVEAEWK